MQRNEQCIKGMPRPPFARCEKRFDHDGDHAWQSVTWRDDGWHEMEIRDIDSGRYVQ